MLHKILSLIFSIVFIISSPWVPELKADEIILPKPGLMVNLSPAFTPAYLSGISIHPEDALKFDFIINKGELDLNDQQKRDEYTRLIKYFLASLTVADKDQWVNLSPYEKNRIIEDGFGKTEMGRDLLAQDYLLKQITSSLIYPEKGLGKKFWDKVYQRAWQEYHTSDVPVNTFNKVWIVPDKAVIYESTKGRSAEDEKGHVLTAYVLENHLKVMLEEDYVASKVSTKDQQHNPPGKLTDVSSKVMREVILPELEKEVNEGKNFALLRQVYSGMLLAAWYKRVLKESFLGKVYADKGKFKGVNQDNPQANEIIYQQYLQAYKKGVYNYIKEDMDQDTHQLIPRKYFSGGTKGFSPDIYDKAVVVSHQADPAMVLGKIQHADVATVSMDAAMIGRRGFLGGGLGALVANGFFSRYAKAWHETPTFNHVKSPHKSIDAFARSNAEAAKIMRDLRAFVADKEKSGGAVSPRGGVFRDITEAFEKANQDLIKFNFLVAPQPRGKKLMIMEYFVVDRSRAFNNIFVVIPLSEPEPDFEKAIQASSFQLLMNEGFNVGKITMLFVNHLEFSGFLVQRWLNDRNDRRFDSVTAELYNKQWPSVNDERIDQLRNALLNSAATHEYEHSRGGDEVDAYLSQLILGQRPFYELAAIWRLTKNGNDGESHTEASKTIIKAMTKLSGRAHEDEFRRFIIGSPRGDQLLRAFALQVYITHRKQAFFSEVMVEAARQFGIQIDYLLKLDQQQASATAGDIDKDLHNIMLRVGIAPNVVNAFTSNNIDRLWTEDKIVDSMLILREMVLDSDKFINRLNELTSQIQRYFDQANAVGDEARSIQMQGRRLQQTGRIPEGNAKIAEGNVKMEEANQLMQMANAKHVKFNIVRKKLISFFNAASEELKLPTRIKASPAMNSEIVADPLGGIDLTKADILIKRDGKGIPLPLILQDMAQLNQIDGFEPHIIEIKPAFLSSLVKELQ